MYVLYMYTCYLFALAGQHSINFNLMDAERGR